MLSIWTELLPLFVVKWMARRYCDRILRIGEPIYCTARPDVLVKKEVNK